MRVFFFAAACFFSKGTCIAQDLQPSIFIGASFQNNLSSASIDAYDGSVLCGVFTSGAKPAVSFDGGVTIPWNKDWSVGGELQYSNLSTSFTTPAQSSNAPLIFNPSGGTYASVYRDRYYDANLGMASLSAMVSYSLFSHVRISAGPFVGLFLQHSYSETESLVSPTPANAVYTNGQQTRTISSGQIEPFNTVQFGLNIGASYEMLFEPHLGLRPSVSAMIPLTAVQSSTSWRVFPVGGSLELVYHLSEPPAQEVPAQEPPAPTPAMVIASPKPPTPPKRAMLSVSVKALGVGDDGKEVSEPVISIERTHVTEVYPMLHYVFFDDGSSVIPERYHRETAATRGEFHEKDLFTANALEIHHHVLDILGERLSNNPDASITLVGTRSEHSPDDSLLWSVISMNRAKSVQDYLANVWGISRDRIRLRDRALPDAASDDHNPFGQAENRRVEIIPSSPEITAPLWTERIERVATPPRIDFEPEITASSGIRTATITVYQHGRVLRTIDALTDSSGSDYLWTIDDRSMPDDVPNAQDSLLYVFSAIDSLGDTAQASGVIRLRKQTSDITRHAGDTVLDKQLERFSLILFDYSSSQLDKKESEAIVKDMASAIKDRAHVMLTGHTDKTGDDAFNDRLARDRVTRAAQMLDAELKKLGEKPPPLAIESRGSRDDLFDNSIPEGRVLSRTVRASVENEMKKQ
jgi:outer membrane protein OmpA-like peptidoglycan-associated protein